MSFYQILLLVFVIIGCNGQNPRSFAHKVNILERRLNAVSNLRSHEIADIYQKLDEIDKTMNKSLESYEKLCSIDSKIENADIEDVTILETHDATNKLENDLVQFRRAFAKEKVILAELRKTFPILTKQVERIQELTSDLQKKSKYMNSIFREVKSETGKHSSEIQELGRVINDIQTNIEFLTDNVGIIENKSKKYDTENTRQATEMQQLKLKVTDYQIENKILSDTIRSIENKYADFSKIIIDLLKDHFRSKQEAFMYQMKFGKMTEEIEKIKSDIDIYKSQLTNIFNDLHSDVRTFSSCVDAINKGYALSGIYSIRLDFTKKKLKVYCDQVTDGGGWIVFQRRIDGTEDFYRGWEEYKEGFGNLRAEFWLGNEYLNAITATGQHELRIDMEDFEGTKAFAQYKSIKIDDESQKYKLEVSDYHGNASDSLISFHSGREFSTKDRDNDLSNISNCAKLYTGAWWYRDCHESNLNGKYYKLGRSRKGKGILWYHFKKRVTHSLKFVEMKLR